jgi:hypothetical protein
MDGDGCPEIFLVFPLVSLAQEVKTCQLYCSEKIYEKSSWKSGRAFQMTTKTSRFRKLLDGCKNQPRDRQKQKLTQQ